MTKEQFIKFANQYCAQAARVMLLDSFHPIEVEVTTELQHKDALAEAKFTFPYKSIQISCSPDILKETEDTVKDILVHELSHAITDPLYGSAFDRFITKPELENRREELTDHIANIILKNKLI